MRRYIVLNLVVWVSLVMLTMTSAFAASASSFKYSESYNEKVLCSKQYVTCDVFDFGKFTISANLLLAGKDIDITKIDGNTEFYLEVGDIIPVDVVLGDGLYIQGKNKATFVLSGYDSMTDQDNVPYLWITLSWNTKNLKVTIKGLTPDIQSPIIADVYLYGDGGTYNDDIGGDVIFAGAEWTFDVPSIIKVKQSTKKDKYKESWDLWSITASGKGQEVTLTP